MTWTNTKYRDHKARDLCVQKLSEDAVIPTRSNYTDAGYDLYVPHDFLIMPHTRALVPTHISMAIPLGYAGLIWDRSGLAVKKGLHRAAGVIDSGYRGEIKVCLWNLSDEEVHLRKGDRIAQLIFQSLPQFDLVEVESLQPTERGSDGFGSTGN